MAHFTACGVVWMESPQTFLGSSSAPHSLCDLGQVTVTPWASVSSSIKWGEPLPSSQDYASLSSGDLDDREAAIYPPERKGVSLLTPGTAMTLVSDMGFRDHHVYTDPKPQGSCSWVSIPGRCLAWLPGTSLGRSSQHLNVVCGGEAGGDSGVLPGKMWGHTTEVRAAVGATDMYTVTVSLKHEMKGVRNRWGSIA